MQNVNDFFFDGQYKDIWRTIIPEQLTVKESEFLINHFALNQNTRVLDLMCGYGRHAISLGRKQIPVVAVDNLKEYVDEISHIANAEKIPITVIQSSVIGFSPDSNFDLAICMGNSFNFFDKDDCLKIIRSVHSSLKTKGKFLINSWSIAEIAIKEFTPKSWAEINGLKVLSDSKFLFHPTRIETDSFFIDADRNTETKKAVDYIYSVSEMESMLAANGFRVVVNYSIPGRKEFALGDTRSYLIAEKV